MDKIAKHYLDNCCYNRPYDDQSVLLIYLETQAKLLIQELIKNNDLYLAWSFILDFENNAHPDEFTMNQIFYWKKEAVFMINKTEEVLVAAIDLLKNGFGNKDALHIASAIQAKVEYFITVEKGILNKKRFINELRIVSPIEFISILEDNYA